MKPPITIVVPPDLQQEVPKPRRQRRHYDHMRSLQLMAGSPGRPTSPTPILSQKRWPWTHTHTFCKNAKLWSTSWLLLWVYIYIISIINIYTFIHIYNIYVHILFCLAGLAGGGHIFFFFWGGGANYPVHLFIYIHIYIYMYYIYKQHLSTIHRNPFKFVESTSKIGAPALHSSV